MKGLSTTYLDQFAIYKQYKPGKCESSCFADGGHRVGYVPVLSLLDGGLAGDSCKMICLECESIFEESIFVVLNQPNELAR